VQATPLGEVLPSSANDEIIFLPFVVSVFPYDESLAWGSDTFDHFRAYFEILFCGLPHMCAAYVGLDIALELRIVQDSKSLNFTKI